MWFIHVHTYLCACLAPRPHPCPAQLSVASLLQATESWAGHGNKAIYVMLYLGRFFIMTRGATWLSGDDHSIVVVNGSPSLQTCRIKYIFAQSSHTLDSQTNPATDSLPGKTSHTLPVNRSRIPLSKVPGILSPGNHPPLLPCSPPGEHFHYCTPRLTGWVEYSLR